MSKYHWRDGWYFDRTEDGSVVISKGPREEAHQALIIPPNEWASIVASVSASSETAESFAAAQRLHNDATEEEVQG